METKQAMESNKRKIESSSTGNDDDKLKQVKKYVGAFSDSTGNDDYKLRAEKCKGEEGSPSSSSDTCKLSSTNSKSSDESSIETSENDEDYSQKYKCDDDDDDDDDDDIDYAGNGQKCLASRSLADAVVAHYNNEATNKYKMEVIWIRETIVQAESPMFIHFICFDAKLTAKEGEDTKHTNCRSVLVREYGGVSKVYSLKLGDFKDIDITKWFKWHPGRMVLYSDSETEWERAPPTERAPPVEDTDSDCEEKDVDAEIGVQQFSHEAVAGDVIEDEDADAEEDADTEEDADAEEEDADADARTTRPRIKKCSYLPVAAMREFAKEALAHYEKEGAELKLGKIKEVFFHDLGVEVYHIKFNAKLICKDRNETKRITCQAVVSSPEFGGIIVWSLKSPYLEGNKTDEKWCCEKGDCKCGISWDENVELLKYACPDWYVSDDEQVEIKKTKHEFPEPPPAF